MDKVKILFIHHGAGWGGAPISLINLIINLDRSKFEPHVLLLKDSIVKEKLKENGIAFTICDLNFYSKWYRYFTHSDAGFIEPFRFFKLSRMLISWFLSKYIYAPKVLSKYKYDIVHLNSSVLSDWIYPASKKGKVIYHIREPISRGWFGLRYKFIRSEVVKYADKVIAISKDNARRINLPGKTEVVYNFIQIPENVKEDKFPKNVLYVGGASKIKGIETLIEAIPFIDKDICITMAGSYPNLKPLSKMKSIAYKIRYPSAYHLREKLEKISKKDNVRIIGVIPSITVALEKSTLLISPFTVPHFSRPVIEAFAYAKPVIVSDVVGMEEIVGNNVNGIIIENGNAKEFASAINSLVNNQKLVKKMGNNGRKKAVELYSPQRNINIIENIYKSLITQ